MFRTGIALLHAGITDRLPQRNAPKPFATDEPAAAHRRGDGPLLIERALIVRLRVWERLGLLSPERDPATGYRSYDQAQLIRARVIALLRASGWSVAAAKDVMDAMRDGDPARTRTALRSRLAELDRLSWKRMRATATLFNYVQAIGPPVQ